MDRERIDLILERTILGLVLAILIYTPLAIGTVKDYDFALITWLTAGVVAFWLARIWLAPQCNLLWPPVCWAVVAFAIYAVVRCQFAVIEYPARQEVFRILVYVVLFFAVLNNLFRQEHVRVIGLVVIFLAMAISFYAVYQLLSGSTKIWFYAKPAQYAGRGSGTFFCPNNLAGYLEMIFPLAVVFAFSRRFGHALRIVMAYAALVILAGVAVTFSRGGYVAVGVGLVILFLMIARNARQRQIVLVLLLIASVGAYFFAQSNSRMIQQRLAYATNLGHDRDLRYGFASVCLKMWQDQPWWGLGPAHFDYRFPQYRPASDRMQVQPLYAHNDWLNTLADYGAVGAGLVLATWFLAFAGARSTWKLLKRSSDGEPSFRSHKRVFIMGSVIALACMLVHCLLDFNMHIPANAILAVVLLALLTSHWRFATEQYWIPLRMPGKILASLTLAFAFVFLGVNGVRNFIEALWLDRADKAETVQDKLHCLAQAHLANRTNHETTYKIGEFYRRQSWQGNSDWRLDAIAAMPWYQATMDLNPYYSHAPMRYGMCLHWLKRNQEAAPWFERALRLDPNSFYISNYVGWHYFQLEKYLDAMRYFARSQALNSMDNPMAYEYYSLSHRLNGETRK